MDTNSGYIFCQKITPHPIKVSVLQCIWYIPFCRYRKHVSRNLVALCARRLIKDFLHGFSASQNPTFIYICMKNNPHDCYISKLNQASPSSLQSNRFLWKWINHWYITYNLYWITDLNYSFVSFTIENLIFFFKSVILQYINSINIYDESYTKGYIRCGKS